MILQDIYTGTVRLTERLRQSEAEREALELENQRLSSEFGAAKAELLVCAQMRQSYERDVAELKNLKSKSDTRIEELYVQFASARAENDALQQRVVDLEVRNRALQDTVEKSDTVRVSKHIAHAEEARKKTTSIWALTRWSAWRALRKTHTALQRRAERFSWKTGTKFFSLWAGVWFHSKSCQAQSKLEEVQKQAATLTDLQCAAEASADLYRIQESALIDSKSLNASLESRLSLAAVEQQAFLRKADDVELDRTCNKIYRFALFWTKVLPLRKSLIEWNILSFASRKKQDLLLKFLARSSMLTLIHSLQSWTRFCSGTSREQVVTLRSQLDAVSQLNHSNEKCIALMIEQNKELNSSTNDLMSLNNTLQNQLTETEFDLKSWKSKFAQCRIDTAAARTYRAIIGLNRIFIARFHKRWWAITSKKRNKSIGLEHLKQRLLTRNFARWLQKVAAIKEQAQLKSMEMLAQELALVKEKHVRIQDCVSRMLHVQTDMRPRQNDTDMLMLLENFDAQRCVARVVRVVRFWNKSYLRSYTGRWISIINRKRRNHRLCSKGLRVSARASQHRIFAVWATTFFDYKEMTQDLRLEALEQELIEVISLKIAAEARVSFVLQQQQHIEASSTENWVQNQDLLVKLKDVEEKLQSLIFRTAQEKNECCLIRTMRAVLYLNKCQTRRYLKFWARSAERAGKLTRIVNLCRSKNIYSGWVRYFTLWISICEALRADRLHAKLKEYDHQAEVIERLEHEKCSQSDANKRLRSMAEEKKRAESLTRVARVVVFWRTGIMRKMLRNWSCLKYEKCVLKQLLHRGIHRLVDSRIRRTFLSWFMAWNEAKAYAERLNVIALEQKLVAIADIKESNEESIMKMLRMQQQMELSVQENYLIRKELENKLAHTERDLEFVVFKQKREELAVAAERVVKVVTFWNRCSIFRCFQSLQSHIIKKARRRNLIHRALAKMRRRLELMNFKEWASVYVARSTRETQKIWRGVLRLGAGYCGQDVKKGQRNECEASGDLLFSFHSSNDFQSMKWQANNRVGRVVSFCNTKCLSNAFRRQWSAWTRKRRVLHEKDCVGRHRYACHQLASFFTSWMGECHEAKSNIKAILIEFLEDGLLATQNVIENTIHCVRRGLEYQQALTFELSNVRIAQETINASISATRVTRVVKFWKAVSCRKAVAWWKTVNHKQQSRRRLTSQFIARTAKGLLLFVFEGWVDWKIGILSQKDKWDLAALEHKLCQVTEAKLDAEARVAFLLEAQRQTEASVGKAIFIQQSLETKLADAEKGNHELRRQHEEERKAKSAVRMVLFWTKASLRRSWNKWDSMVEMRQKHKLLLRTTVAKLSGSVLAGSFYAWQRHWDEILQNRRMQEASRRMEPPEQQRAITRVCRVIIFWSKSLIRRVWNQIFGFILSKIRMRQTEMIATARFIRTLLQRAFRTLTSSGSEIIASALKAKVERLEKELQETTELKEISEIRCVSLLQLQKEMERIWDIKQSTLRQSLEQRIAESGHSQEILRGSMEEQSLKQSAKRVMRAITFWRTIFIRRSFEFWQRCYLVKSRRRYLLQKGLWSSSDHLLTRYLMLWISHIDIYKIQSKIDAERLKTRTLEQLLAKTSTHLHDAEARIAALLEQQAKLENVCDNKDSALRTALAEAEERRGLASAAEENQIMALKAASIRRVLKLWGVNSTRQAWIQLVAWTEAARNHRRLLRKAAGRLLQRGMASGFAVWQQAAAETHRRRVAAMEDRLKATVETRAEKSQRDVAFLLDHVRVAVRTLEGLVIRLNSPSAPGEALAGADSSAAAAAGAVRADVARWRAEAEVLRLEAQRHSMYRLALP